MICSFSPCIEQTQRTCLALSEHGFYDITTLESINRPHRVSIVGKDEDSEDFDEDDEEENDGDEEQQNFNRKKKNTKTSLKRERDDKKSNLVIDLNNYVTKPVASIRGHSGFLTFARKALNVKKS